MESWTEWRWTNGKLNAALSRLYRHMNETMVTFDRTSRNPPLMSLWDVVAEAIPREAAELESRYLAAQ